MLPSLKSARAILTMRMLGTRSAFYNFAYARIIRMLCKKWCILVPVLASVIFLFTPENLQFSSPTVDPEGDDFFQMGILQKWALSHALNALHGISSHVTCSLAEDALEKIVRQRHMSSKLALVHISSQGSVFIKSGDTDGFTTRYIRAFSTMLEEAVLVQGKCENCNFGNVSAPAATFLVTSCAFGDQVDGVWRKLGIHDVALFSSCMSPQLASAHGVFIPRPYKPREDLLDTSTAMNDSQFRYSWNRKQPKVVFRGALSSFDRVILMKFVQSLPFNTKERFLDVNITLIPAGAPCAYDRTRWCPGVAHQWIEEYNLTFSGKAGMMSMKDQQNNFKYILTVDGVGCGDRVKILLGSSSIVLKQDSPFIEFWYSDLIDGIHYKKVRGDMEDLIDVVHAAENLPYEVQRSIVKKANEYVSSYILHPDANACFVKSLLFNYGNLLQRNSQCEIPTGAVPFRKWNGKTTY